MLLVTHQAFTVNDSERVNGLVRFQFQALTGLFLVKLQVFTINNSEEFCGRTCNGNCLQLQNVTDLYLEKTQAFTTDNSFCSTITL